MDALYRARAFDVTDLPESVANLLPGTRSRGVLPGRTRGPALPYFVDWLIENVHLVEITAYSDGDAYTIFETMNDRGLSLIPRTCSRVPAGQHHR